MERFEPHVAVPSEESVRDLMSRRALLGRGVSTLLVAGVAPALLAACGSSTQGASAVGGRIDFMSWEGYDAPDAMAKFKQSNNITLKATYMGSHDEIQTKILAAKGQTSFDLITYAQDYAALYTELKIITPLDESKIPNLKNLFPFFAGNYRNYWVAADGTRTGVPFNWGYIGLGYDADAIEAPKSYMDLLDPRFKGKLGMTDDLTAVTQLSAKLVGVTVAHMTQTEYSKVKELLAKFIAQTKGISPTYGDLATRFASGDIVASFACWPPVDQMVAKAGKKSVKTILSEAEGGIGYCDSLAIPPAADNADASYAWINETLKPATAAAIDNKLGTGTPVEGAAPLLDPALRSDYHYDNLDAFFARAPMNALAPFKSDKYVTWPEVVEGWQKLKATA